MVAASAGCRGVLVKLIEHGGGVALAVSAQECVEPDGARASAQQAIARLAEAVWRTAWPRFDSVHATVYRYAELPGQERAYGQVLTRAELERRWGARPAGFDRGVADLSGASLFPWVLLPVAMLIGLSFAVWAGVGLARSGTIWIVFRRR